MWYPIYIIRFKDDDQGLWTVEVQGSEGGLAPIEIEAGENPLTWMGDGNGEQTECLLGATGTLGLYVTDETLPHFTIGKLLPDGALSRRVVAKREGLTVWVGFIQPQTFNQVWEAPPFDTNLALMDTISVLSDIYIDTTETAATTMDLLYSAYKKTGGEASRSDFLRSNVKSYSGKVSIGKDWTESPFFPEYFINQYPDGDRRNYADIIRVLISPFGRLFQTGTRWCVAMDGDDEKIYKPAGGSAMTFDDWTPKTDISHKVAGSNNNQNIVPNPSKVEIDYTPADGEEHFDGGSVMNLNADNIIDPQSPGFTDYRWTHQEGEQEKVKELRYLWTLPILLDLRGSSLKKETWAAHFINAAPYQDDTQYFAPAWYYADGTTSTQMWQMGQIAQVLEKKDGSYSLAKDFALRIIRKITGKTEWRGYPQAERDVWLQSGIFTIGVGTKIALSDGFDIKVKFNANMYDLERPSASDNEFDKHLFDVAAFICWSRNKDAAPEMVLAQSAIDQNVRTWLDCGGVWPDPGMIMNSYNHVPFPAPKFAEGLHFGLPVINGRQEPGYISVRIFAYGTVNRIPIPYTVYDPLSDINIQNEYVNAELAISDFAVSYNAIEASPTTMMDWNTDAAYKKTYQYNGGVGSIVMGFKTLTGNKPSLENLHAPRWGFYDRDDAVITAPREMLDIEAVQVTASDGIPGVTRFSLFQFNGATYFPAAVGMNAKDNTVRLKLIRTL